MDALSELRVAPLLCSRAGIAELHARAAGCFTRKVLWIAERPDGAFAERIAENRLRFGNRIRAQLEMGKIVTLWFDESRESGKGRKKTETAVPLRPGERLVRNLIEPP